MDGSYGTKGVLVVPGLDVPAIKRFRVRSSSGITSVKSATVKGTFDYVTWTGHPRAGTCVAGTCV